MQFGTSKAKIKHGKVSRRLRSFFQGGRSVSAAQPMDVHDVPPQNESQMVDEPDRSTKLEDLNSKDWPLEDSFKPVSNFLDSMLSNSQDTELERSIRTPSPSSVSSSKRSLHETSIQIYQKQDQQLKALEQQMDEMSIFSAQGTRRREGETASASASTNAVDKCRSAGTPQKCRYQCFKRRQIRTIETANKRHGGGPNIFGHYNHGYC